MYINCTYIIHMQNCFHTWIPMYVGIAKPKLARTQAQLIHCRPVQLGSQFVLTVVWPKYVYSHGM